MLRALLILLAIACLPSWLMACGLDWTLPTNHFDGVEEHGYVSYWEKIGEADLGDGLVIPVNINFNSHREASSPYLGKGWIVALLESHVEPLDENSMKVVMPDGWNFYFHRDGNSETWHGNAGWVGETNNTIFTITAPCGWRIKFDGGKIQEIDSNKNRTLSYKYNGPAVSEVDVDGKAFLQVDNDPSTGAPADMVIGGQKIAIALAQRPRVEAKLTENLVTGFDPSLSLLQWPDGKKESFSFGTNKALNPTLTITYPENTLRDFTWDVTSRQIKTDGEWTYQWPSDDHMPISRTNTIGQSQSFLNDARTGLTIEQHLDGSKVETKKFTSGNLAGLTRSITREFKGHKAVIEAYDYDEQGRIIRETRDGITKLTIYDIKDITAIRPITLNADRITYIDSSGNILRVITKLTDTDVHTLANSGRALVTTYSNGMKYSRLINDKGELIGITQN